MICLKMLTSGLGGAFLTSCVRWDLSRAQRLIKQHMGGGFISPICECGANKEIQTHYWF